MNWKNLSILIVAVSVLGMLVACQTAQTVKEGDESMPETKPTMIDPTPVPESAFAPLPQRYGSQTQTSGSVPHVQIGIEPVPEVNAELFRRAFALPDVENRPTIVSLPGTRGMWLSDGVPLAHAEGIVSGREFAHIHPDGSLHAPLPYERALEAAEKGWAERHPWADQRDGWQGLVMLFTPQSMAELDVTFQLIVESYNHVTGRTVQASDFQTDGSKADDG
jgi:phospholipase/carboxylesterase